MENHVKAYLVRLRLYSMTFFKWLVIALSVGAVSAVVGVAFSWVLVWVTQLRTDNAWLLFLLPVIGIIITFFYQKTGMWENQGTNGVFTAVREGTGVPFRLTPLIFISTALTHLGGGSAGREGAALQMGGSIGATAARLFKLDNYELRICMICGMSAVFSALFGTPVTAALFCIEVINVGVFHYSTLVPALCSALTAYRLAVAMGREPIIYALPNAPATFNFDMGTRTIILGAMCAAVSVLLCMGMHASSKIYKKLIPRPYLRGVVGGVLIIILTLAVHKIFGNYDYNGAGMELAVKAMSGEKIFPAAFLLKLIFTMITLGAGFRGGEIVPTLCIGASFGSVAGAFLGLDPAFGAALGLVGVFCGAVNCPIASIFLSIEFFGSDYLLYFAVICAVSNMLSGRFSLYSAQHFVVSKLFPMNNPNDKINAH